MFYFSLVLAFLFSPHAVFASSRYDLTLVGYVQSDNGLGSLPIRFINCLKDDISINFISTRKRLGPNREYNPLGIPQQVQDILEKTDETPAPISLFSDVIWFPGYKYYSLVPAKSLIKIAYSMFESSTISQEWVRGLNNKFDAVVVPDEWLVDVYKKSGVTIPLFVIPIVLDLATFLKQPAHQAPRKPFIFGNTCVLEPRKNHDLLVRAFARAFGNARDVRLHIHAPYENKSELDRLKSRIKALGLTNVDILVKSLTNSEYLSFMSSLDAYVSFSKGEGFSITPREALALGIPVILSNNTAHKTLCSTGFVTAVSSAIPERAFNWLFNKHMGYHYNCRVDDAAAALRDVYANYARHLAKAQQGRTWVMQYLPDNLKYKYLTLIKPTQVMKGLNNSLDTNGCLTTDSPGLYQKYKQLEKLQKRHIIEKI